LVGRRNPQNGKRYQVQGGKLLGEETFPMAAKIDRDKLRALSQIMGRVHALADYAWPRNDEGVSPMTRDAERLIIDIQEQASKALGLSETNLMTGDPTIDLD
jgi:hypothetical protein